MKPDEIKALRKELRCTPRELAAALNVTTQEVMDWEAEDRFPTKQFIERMDALRDKGPAGIVRMRGRRATAGSPMKVLSDPEMWRLVRKLIAHPELREQVQALADQFDEPNAE